ncbi:zinc finger protein [Loa loa]|uniref:Zinc finger protein n=1 Tax=Loa loa TaxID=7209 RepID=A0A1S0TNX1_LOALO|nr:zinc finger protein [Loa loa]EFO16700.2 zinc finger protein [Loa loa]
MILTVGCKHDVDHALSNIPNIPTGFYVKKYECPHVDCNATIQDKGEYDKHFQTHDKPFRYQCKLPDSAEGNPQLGHTLADTRNHHIAGQGLAAQQDRSSGGYPPENFNIFDVLTLTILTSSTMLTSPTTSKYFGTSENCLLAVY